jgi:hypothetical protein
MAYTLEAKGTILTLGGAPIGYKYSKQKSISTNSTGAEVIALADSLSVVIWARDLLTDLGFPQSQPTQLALVKTIYQLSRRRQSRALLSTQKTY